MYKDIIGQCPTKNKTIRTKSGKKVKSPPCKSNYCPRCCWLRKWEIMTNAPHMSAYIDCHQTYLVLPYYRLVSRSEKKKINKSFWDSMRRQYGELEFIHTLEQQGGHVHVNYHVLSDFPLSEEHVIKRWTAACKHQGISVDPEDIYVEPVKSSKAVTRYIVKGKRKDPENYLPVKGMYQKVMYFSAGYDEFVRKRAADTLIADLFTSDEFLEGLKAPKTL